MLEPRRHLELHGQCRWDHGMTELTAPLAAVVHPILNAAIQGSPGTETHDITHQT